MQATQALHMHNGNINSPKSVVYSNTVAADTNHHQHPLLVVNAKCGSSLPSIMDIIDRAYNSRQYEIDLSYKKHMCQSRGTDRVLLHVHKL